MGHGPHWGLMGDSFGGMGPLNIISWIIGLILVAALVAWFIRTNSAAKARNDGTELRRVALDVLEDRYARGEINREEFLQKKQDIGG